MRAGACCVFLAWGVTGCASKSADVSHTHGPTHVFGTGGNGGTGGAFTGVGGGFLFNTGGAPGDPPVEHPSYTRECLTARPTVPRVDAGSPARVPDAGRPARKDAGVDIGLGQGDLTVLVVFDKSGSMAFRWDDGTKWDVANDAFMNAIEPVIDNLTIGTIFFPEPGGCAVAPLDGPLQMPFSPGRRFMENWKATESSRAPDGSTPLELALEYADQAVEDGCRLGLLDDRFRVLLITDGEPTCMDDPDRVVARAADWRRVGVETWVMGLPGSEGARNLLDGIAMAGGTGAAHLLGTPQALEDTIAAATR